MLLNIEFISAYEKKIFSVNFDKIIMILILMLTITLHKSTLNFECYEK